VLQSQEIDEETDEPIHSHEGAIDSFMIPLQWLEIRHFSLDGELVSKTASAIYALSYDQECFTIMDHESTNISPQMELAPFRCTSTKTQIVTTVGWLFADSRR
jgi:hypothetical protein